MTSSPCRAAAIPSDVDDEDLTGGTSGLGHSTETRNHQIAVGASGSIYDRLLGVEGRRGRFVVAETDG